MTAWDRSSGLPIGATEVTRCGMNAPEMTRIAELMSDVLQAPRPADAVKQDEIDLRRLFPVLRYCFPNGVNGYSKRRV